MFDSLFIGMPHTLVMHRMDNFTHGLPGPSLWLMEPCATSPASDATGTSVSRLPVAGPAPFILFWAELASCPAGGGVCGTFAVLKRKAPCLGG